MTLPDVLPIPFLRKKWVRVDNFPTGKKVGKYSMVIDRVHNRDGTAHSICVAYVRDHKFLGILNGLPYVPRAVKSVFRAEKRLGHALATDALPVIRELDAAYDGWCEYLINARKNGLL